MPNCRDGSDETNCEKCVEFKCKKNDKCIPSKLFKIEYINIKLFIIQNYLKESWVCDSNPDCGYLDYSDEENCKCKLNYKP